MIKILFKKNKKKIAEALRPLLLEYYKRVDLCYECYDLSNSIRVILKECGISFEEIEREWD